MGKNDSEEEGSCNSLDSAQAKMHDNLNHNYSLDKDILGYLKKGVILKKVCMHIPLNFVITQIIILVFITFAYVSLRKTYLKVLY